MRQTILRRGPEIRRRILLVVVFMTPLFFLRGAYDPFNVPKLWLLMVGVVIVAAIRCVELLQGAETSGLYLLRIPAAAVAGALVIGTVFSPYRVWSLIGDHSRFTGLVPYLVVILLGVLVADAFRGDVTPLAWAMAASGAVAGVYALVQVFGLDPLEWSNANEAVVTIGNTNFSGAFFAICLPLAVTLILIEPDRRFAAIGVTALVLVGWVLARSELAWAAGVAGLLLLASIFLSRKWKLIRPIAYVAVALIATAGVGVVVLAMTQNPPGFIPGTIERRAEWWQASLRMAGDSPVVGRGPNSFAIEHTHHRDVDDVAAGGLGVTDDPHSVPLSFLTGAGIFGIAGWIVFAGWIVVGVARARPEEPLAVAFSAAAGVYLVQSLLSIDVVTLRFSAWTVIGGMAAAFAPIPAVRKKAPPSKRGRKKAQTKSVEPLKSLPGVVATILVAGVAIAWASGFLAADRSFRRGLSLAAGGAPGAKESLESAVNFRESNYTYRGEYGRLLGGNAVQEALAEDGDPGVARELLREARDAFAIVGRIPHANTVLTYARMMRDWAQVEESAQPEALALYERAAELDPSNYRILEEYAEAAESFGLEDLAEELAARADRLRSRAES